MSINIKVYNQKAEETGEIKLSDKVFGLKANEALIHQAVVAQMSNERQVLAHTKDRSEVRGGGRKPWSQKGTGRARAGSNRSPIWIGGGVTFGPRNDRNFKKDINKKMKQKAMCMVLSDRMSGKATVVVDELKFTEYKTKAFNDVVLKIEQKVLKIDKKTKRGVLIIIDVKDDKLKFSGRNLTGIKIINLNNINILDVLKYKNLVITKESIKKIEEKYLNSK